MLLLPVCLKLIPVVRGHVDDRRSVRRTGPGTENRLAYKSEPCCSTYARRRWVTLQPAESGGWKFREICTSTGEKKHTHIHTMNSKNRIRVSPIVMSPPPPERRCHPRSIVPPTRFSKRLVTPSVLVVHAFVIYQRRGVWVAVLLSWVNTAYGIVYNGNGAPGDSRITRTHNITYIYIYIIVL